MGNQAWTDVPYIDANSYGGLRSRTPIVVIHATDNNADAYHEAVYCSNRLDGTSAHFYVDAASIYQCVPVPNSAHTSLYHGNQISVQFELCGYSNQLSDAVMRNAAKYVKRICDLYGIPIVKLSYSQVRSAYYDSPYPKGICGHADVTDAFPEDNGTHTDPGPSFSWSTFLNYVKGGSMTETDRMVANIDNFWYQGLSLRKDPIPGFTWSGDPTTGTRSLPNVTVQQWDRIEAKIGQILAALPALSDDEANIKARIDAAEADEVAKLESLRTEQLAAIESARASEATDEADTRSQVLAAISSLTGAPLPANGSALGDTEFADALQAAVDHIRSTATA